MSINIIAENALLKHINVRTQGNVDADEPTVAIDIDYELVLDDKILMPLLGCTEPVSFWTEGKAAGDGQEATQGGALKYPGMGPLSSKAKIKEAQMTFGDITINNVKAKKFKILLLANRQVQLNLQVQAVPNDDQYLAVKNAILQRAKLTISATEQKDIFDDSK